MSKETKRENINDNLEMILSCEQVQKLLSKLSFDHYEVRLWKDQIEIPIGISMEPFVICEVILCNARPHSSEYFRRDGAIFVYTWSDSEDNTKAGPPLHAEDIIQGPITSNNNSVYHCCNPIQSEKLQVVARTFNGMDVLAPCFLSLLIYKIEVLVEAFRNLTLLLIMMYLVK
ncbi:uncharacterized protein OCT59_025919 [Rhizophagus irregularis]|uniref:uncharacterized protein n=1 Tax=Rhizophagus irregularis TaxID=588596 RepID=UPI001A0C03C3|nr:hypothetical protein OCT59_025919 [Rhizophagus irregularis]GET51932.1 hypothetical protein GLOIN_2v1469368 [Rhizophagus irregularis DAOM 181602=DAOM 197198]